MKKSMKAAILIIATLTSLSAFAAPGKEVGRDKDKDRRAGVSEVDAREHEKTADRLSKLDVDAEKAARIHAKYENAAVRERVISALENGAKSKDANKQAVAKALSELLSMDAAMGADFILGTPGTIEMLLGDEFKAVRNLGNKSGSLLDAIERAKRILAEGKAADVETAFRMGLEEQKKGRADEWQKKCRRA